MKKTKTKTKKQDIDRDLSDAIASYRNMSGEIYLNKATAGVFLKWLRTVEEKIAISEAYIEKLEKSRFLK